ncbi:DNA repair protein RecO [Endozoicomonas ascidiicola]|uniref:DNA repair protein RecO n=1 Tax=Endozoicomonas ascidiicola TaxID=1698521 RepID=UPI00082F52C2|nr:DNA repair protein RecO [Endozoicomonas ascidiicola]
MTITSNTFSGKHSGDFHRAWLLHRRSYKERSVIAEFLVENHGRVAMVVRGVRQSRSSLGSLLQPFHQLMVRWKGRTDLKTLVDLEPAQMSFLAGQRLYCGFYINELLMRALIPGQLVDGVVELYQAALSDLKSDQPIEPLLRSFELDLLELCGYAPPLDWDSQNNEPLKVNTVYRFDPEHGLMPVPATVPHYLQAYCFSSNSLKALSERDFSAPDQYADFKRFNRQAMKLLIGDRPLQSRMLFARRSSAPTIPKRIIEIDAANH